MTPSAIVAALDAHGYDVKATASTLGLTSMALYARASRAGVSIKAARRGDPEAPPLVPTLTAVAPDAHAVRLSLADYALLTSQAAIGASAARELAAADRIIASLTRELEAHACAA